MRSWIPACLALALAAPVARCQATEPGPQVLTFFSAVDDTDQPYAVYVPPGLDRERKYPLVISLHGAGSNHRLNLRRVFGRGNRMGETDAEATRYFPPWRAVDFLVASPLARGTMGYRGIAERDVYDVLADVMRRFPVDEDRVYLTGLSMGGGGTLWLGLTRPDVWAALAAVCPAAPDGTEELAPNALNLPVHLFHGEADPVVPVGVSRRWHKELLRLGTAVEYVEYPGVRHNCWDYAYRDGAIFRWFASHKRERYPERVRFLTRYYRYRSAYWARIDGLTPGSLASLDVRFAGPNELVAETQGLDGFTLELAGHPKFTPKAALRVTVDGGPVSVRVAAEISLRKTAAGWQSGRFRPPAGTKRPGVEGPIAEAVAGRHVYVYGTLGSPSPEELERRRQEAAKAAEWSSPRSRLLVSFRVLADREVKESDWRDGSLVLFGTRETNSLVAKVAPLPVELNAGAADFGLLFVIPRGERYVLVNSGLPWWTDLDQVEGAGYRLEPPVLRALLSLKDFVLFRGSLAGVLAEGFFDRQWRLPPEAAERMKATGAVEVNSSVP